MEAFKKSIVLVGLMGAGKSRVGFELSKILSLPFIDSDREIEKAAGMTIPDIFERFGEPGFRDGEKKVIERLLSETPKVIASGGGAFVQPGVKEVIKNKAISVWLKADIHTLVERTSRTDNRPLLRGTDPAKKLTELMELRYPIYAEADITVVTDNQSPKEMAILIKKQIETFLGQENQ